MNDANSLIEHGLLKDACLLAFMIKFPCSSELPLNTWGLPAALAVAGGRSSHILFISESVSHWFNDCSYLRTETRKTHQFVGETSLCVWSCCFESGTSLRTTRPTHLVCLHPSIPVHTGISPFVCCPLHCKHRYLLVCPWFTNESQRICSILLHLFVELVPYDLSGGRPLFVQPGALLRVRSVHSPAVRSKDGNQKLACQTDWPTDRIGWRVHWLDQVCIHLVHRCPPQTQIWKSSWNAWGKCVLRALICFIMFAPVHELWTSYLCSPTEHHLQMYVSNHLKSFSIFRPFEWLTKLSLVIITTANWMDSSSSNVNNACYLYGAIVRWGRWTIRLNDSSSRWLLALIIGLTASGTADQSEWTIRRLWLDSVAVIDSTQNVQFLSFKFAHALRLDHRYLDNLRACVC